MVGHEPGVEAAALQGLRETDQVFEIEIGVGISARVAPPGGVNADRAHESAQMQLAWSRHRCPALGLAPSWIGCRRHRNIRGVSPNGLAPNATISASSTRLVAAARGRLISGFGRKAPFSSKNPSPGILSAAILRRSPRMS